MRALMRAACRWASLRRGVLVELLMLGYVVLLTASGVLGLAGTPSGMLALALEDAGAALYSLAMTVCSATLVLAVYLSWRNTEAAMLVVVAVLTGLQGAIIIANAGPDGLQTGMRMVAGMLGVLVIAAVRYRDHSVLTGQQVRRLRELLDQVGDDDQEERER